MNKKTLGIIAGALIAATPLVSSAADLLPGAFEANSVLQADGMIKSVDPTQHTVKVVDAQGAEASFTVTDTSNLAQLRPGSKVHVRMTRTALVSPSQKPAAAQSSSQSVTAAVVTVDRATGVVQLKGANGAVFHIQGRDPAKLPNLQPGMHLDVVYAPQVSVAVEPAAQ
jgi:hypothetical protein